MLRYPQGEGRELAARIQSGDDRHFSSATFELLLHEMLLRQNWRVVLHPTMPNGSSGRPDFLVTEDLGHEFYLEAVSASQLNAKDDGAEARKATALDALATAPHPLFVVGVSDEGDPTTQPSGRKLATDIHVWLDTLDVESIELAVRGNHDAELPEMTWQHENWSVSIQAFPVSRQRRGKTTTLLASSGSGAHWVNDWLPIRNALKKKGSKYGELDRPLLVAVNADSFNLDVMDEMQALYGEERHTVAWDDPDSEPHFDRAPNGVWMGKGGPQHRRLSGAWLFNDLTPYTIAARRHTIYLNPWALHRLPDALLRFPHAIATDGTLVRNAGAQPREILGVSADWPEA